MMRQIHLNLYWAPATFIQLLLFFFILLFATISSKPCKFSCKFSSWRITSTHSQIRLLNCCGIKSHLCVVGDSLMPISFDITLFILIFIFLPWNSILLAEWSCVWVMYRFSPITMRSTLTFLFLTRYNTMLWYFHKVAIVIRERY